MKRVILIALAVAVLCGCSGKKSLPAGRLEQAVGQFSFVTPDGWFRTKLPGINFIIVSTEPDRGAKPNIFIDFADQTMSLSNMVTHLSDVNLKNYRSFKISQQTDFATDSGLTGVKITAGRTNRDGLPLAVFHYLIEDSGRIIGITCTCAVQVKQKYESVFDTAMKSLRSEK